MTYSRRITVLLVAAALVAGAFAAAGAQERDRKPKRIKDIKEKKDESRAAGSPLEVFHELEGAWKAEDAGKIAALAGEGRIYLDVRGMGKKGGFFSKSQVFYLFRNMFKSEDQMKFEFVKYHNIDKPDRRVYGIAYRSWKNVRTGKVFQDKVYVTLGREGSGWVVAEIKTTR